MKRQIIEIDRERCNGCGQCVEACAEGALQLIDGRAQVVREEYCDGLGACIGDCPTGALRVVERDAPEFDLTAAREHVERVRGAEGVQRLELQHQATSTATIEPVGPTRAQVGPRPAGHPHQPLRSHGAGGCPGSQVRLPPVEQPPPAPPIGSQGLPPRIHSSDLAQWPVQLHLVPVRAPFFADRELVLLSTCGPVASADIHWRFLRGRSVVVACPKLDITDPYVEKLAAIFRDNPVPRVLIVRMEVPCCGGLTRMATQALRESGRTDLPLEEIILSLDGAVLRQARVA